MTLTLKRRWRTRFQISELEELAHIGTWQWDASAWR